ncbi:glycoside hydrolase family 27 protein [Granulicella sp. 5B5]|uniref:glycoside hydrolase family 27 protein n=1 Tax=Granulicella sp. 5B5 TaxID=1617967 RepID=UPI0015F3CEFC|nr:glycoside hydrolase family 27 protein [Granulicella sp. 5B5]QMV19284.1 glycoside hydrolase family 27 protein [Granulicella sp. 5B5]
MRMRWIAALAVCALGCGVGLAQGAASTGLAMTPPMGWNSWNHFAGKVTEQDVKNAADALVSSGMRDAGYVYVNVDDTWQGTRDAQGVLHANDKFPDMKALGDYIHSKGLKFGIYSSPGPHTCARYEGSYGHEQQDADLYASWGVDYLKYDLCSYRELMSAGAADHPNDPDYANKMMKAAYVKMHEALEKTGRPIVFSLCQYGWDDVWTWGASVGGNLWRTTGDIKDNYDSMSKIGFGQAGLAKYAGPGHWNDPDMLEVGNGHMSADEYRTHMSLWALLAAPLLAGNDLSKMPDETKSILMNKGVIAVDQDRLGRQGDRVSQNGLLEVWSKPLSGGAVAVGLFNRGTSPAEMSVKLSDVGMSSAGKITDLWSGKMVKAKDGEVKASVPVHGVVLLRVEP